jgi:hypothetical protein
LTNFQKNVLIIIIIIIIINAELPSNNALLFFEHTPSISFRSQTTMQLILIANNSNTINLCNNFAFSKGGNVKNGKPGSYQQLINSFYFITLLISMLLIIITKMQLKSD